MAPEFPLEPPVGFVVDTFTHCSLETHVSALSLPSASRKQCNEGETGSLFLLSSLSEINLFIKEENSFSINYKSQHNINKRRTCLTLLADDNVLSRGHFLGPLEGCEFQVTLSDQGQGRLETSMTEDPRISLRKSLGLSDKE